MAVKHAIFLDKDGTLIPDIPYNSDPALISLEKNVGQTLARLAVHYKLIIVSNQSGVAFGYFDENDLKRVERRIESLLQEYGVSLSGFYYCPHHPNGHVTRYTTLCSCRKPNPGLIIRAAAEHDIELTGSWMIGDILNDVQAGKAVGCKSILIDNGNETEWDLADEPNRIPDVICTDFADAGNHILKILKHEKHLKSISSFSK